MKNKNGILPNYIYETIYGKKKYNCENHPKNKKEAKKRESVAELMLRVAGVDINLCQRCQEGRLEIIALVPKEKSPPNYLLILGGPISM